MDNIVLYAKWNIEKLMYYVKADASVDNKDTSVISYDNFDDAKLYVDTLFDKGNGTALGIYDLNNDLVYFPEVEPKTYYITDENGNKINKEYEDFEEARNFVDSEFANGTKYKIYDKNDKLIYEPKEEIPEVQYFVKVNNTDESTTTNTFTNINDAKAYADSKVQDGVKVFDKNGDIVYTPEEDLYLKSDVYKIGTNNTDEKLDEYVDGDLYLYRVSPNTTLADFIANCKTNGKITIYKQDGTELKDNELVGTGMTLKDEKGTKFITISIAVTGDLDGNGEIDITDLVKVRQNIQQIKEITGVYLKAGDINEDESADITDLVKIRKHIQEIEYIK